MIADNVKDVTQRIARSCEKSGRSAGDVSLVCVTKEASVAEMQEAIIAGCRIFGENRVQDAIPKHAILGDKAVWHFIGHLQTNKVKDVIRIFDLVHSVDSVRLAGEIDRQASKIGKVQDILVQVNVSGEASKFGISPEDLDAFLKQAASYRNIAIKGLMTIAPEAADPETVRPYFRRLRELRGIALNLRILSMGMTNDFETAIEEGSTMVRIGRAIFR